MFRKTILFLLLNIISIINIFPDFKFQHKCVVQESNPCTTLSLQLNKTLNNSGKDNLNIVKVIVMNHNTHFRSISFGEQILKGVIFSTLFGSPLSMESLSFPALSCLEVIFEKNIRAARHFPDFMNLPAKLQTTLLKNNSSMLVALCGATVGKGQFPDQITDQLSSCDVKIVKYMMSLILKSQNGTEKSFNKITHENRTHGLNFNDIKVKERHQILESRVQLKVAYDPNLWKILFYIVLFCSDFHDECIDGDARDRISKIQEKLVLILQNYLYATVSQNIAAVRFGNVMESLIELRELSDITNNLRI